MPQPPSWFSVNYDPAEHPLPNPSLAKIEWHGIVGRHAVTSATAERIRDHVAEIAWRLQRGPIADRAFEALLLCDQLCALARLPSPLASDYRGLQIAAPPPREKDRCPTTTD